MSNTDFPFYDIGNTIETGTDVKPDVGEVRPITDASSGVALAWYRITDVRPARYNGGFWLVSGVICEEPVRIVKQQNGETDPVGTRVS